MNRVPKRTAAQKPDLELQTRLGAVIRRYRHGLGLTQEELAWRAGMHRTYIADVERGARNVTLRVTANLARALQVSVENLFAHVAALAGSARPGAEMAPHEVRDILMVESNALAAAATVRAFQRARLANPIKIVRDGEGGLDYLFGTGRYAKRKPARPQLILLNLDQPKMPGNEFLRRVKSDARTREIPVVVLTALP
jgi:transcriptional regulator with XRE-family HTH domain